MRLYYYLNKEIIKRLAGYVPSLSFNIDFFEYSEKSGYTRNSSTSIRPEIGQDLKNECDKSEKWDRTRLNVSGDKGTICNFQVERRYINIEDVSSIKNNSFYYEILEKIPLDNRVKLNTGNIQEITDKYFILNDNKYLVDKDIISNIEELYENTCELNVIGYKINCMDLPNDVYKIIAIYIE